MNTRVSAPARQRDLHLMRVVVPVLFTKRMRPTPAKKEHTHTALHWEKGATHFSGGVQIDQVKPNCTSPKVKFMTTL